jgi:imidazole glycerol-phosphate synthase subunit HisH
MGNLRSVQKAFEFLGEKVCVSESVAGAERLVIPGVGAFGAAMERLLPLKKDIRDFADSGQPVLGICLGQQLLFESSDEHGETEGLGLLGGKVEYFPEIPGLKVPHIGWTGLTFRSNQLGRDLENGQEVYFVHSLFTNCSDSEDVAATANYGIDFPAAVQRKNVWGAQFHPEKSSTVGLQILRNWLAC